MAAESSGVRSVNTGDICGAVTRRMMKANTPTSAAVTAAMAPTRAAPSVRMNSTRPCNGLSPAIRGGRSAPDPASFAGFMVSIWLTAAASVHALACAVAADAQKQRRRREGRRVSERLRFAALLPVLLDARRAQAGEAVAVDRILPGEEFLDGQCVARARFLKRQKAATNRGHHFRLAADDPATRAGSRQIGDRQGAAVGPDDILDPRAMGFVHSGTHTYLLILNRENTSADLKFS